MFKDIRIIEKKEIYTDHPCSQIIKLLSELEDRVIETYAWRFTYKGEKYGHVITGTRTNPITDKRIIKLMQNMAKTMEALVKKN